MSEVTSIDNQSQKPTLWQRITAGKGGTKAPLVVKIIFWLIILAILMVVAVSLQNVAVFLIFVGFLYLRPQGILGKKGRAI